MSALSARAHETLDARELRCVPLSPPGSYGRAIRMLIVADEAYLAKAVRDGLRLGAIAADGAGDGESALATLAVTE